MTQLCRKCQCPVPDENFDWEPFTALCKECYHAALAEYDGPEDPCFNQPLIERS